MAKRMLVNINMFALNQDIVIEENGLIDTIVSVEMNNLNDMIFSIMNEEDIEEIEIGGNQNFIQNIGYEILENFEKIYSNRNVRIKLNGKVFN